MVRVKVQPDTFTMVEYDAGRIAEVATEVAAAAGLGDDVELVIDVDETSPFGYVRSQVDGTTVVITAESAAFEDPKNPRHLSIEGSRQMLGRVLFRVADRLDESFGDPPPDVDLTYEQQTAWDAYALGRLERRGFDGHKERRRYHFRMRHGFTDLADRVFDRLWAAENLTWGDIDAACTETAAVRPEPIGGRAGKKLRRSA